MQIFCLFSTNNEVTKLLHIIFVSIINYYNLISSENIKQNQYQVEYNLHFCICLKNSNQVFDVKRC